MIYGATDRPLPILRLVGRPGAGKTALLGSLAAELGAHVPFAKLDFSRLGSEKGPGVTLRQILWLLVLELSSWHANYGRLTFGRFLVGELAISCDITGLDHGQARTKVRESLKKHHHVDRFERYLETLVGGAAELALPRLNLNVRVKQVVEDMVGGLAGWRPTQRLLLGKAAAWYGTPATESLDCLVKLNRNSKGEQVEQDAAGKLVLAAFLADVDEQFGRRRPLHKRPLYCPVLVDNVETGAGSALLGHLARDRTGTRPLVVVVTGQLSHSGVAPRDPEKACYEDWKRAAAGQAEPADSARIYEVALRDLSVGEIAELVQSLKVPEPRRIAASLHRLTLGHPAGTTLVATALKERLAKTGRQRDGVATGLRKVLDPPADPNHESLPDRVLRELLKEIDHEDLAQLVTCAAARNISDALRLMAEVGLNPPVDLGAGPWITHTENRPRELHPLVRYLLLDKLAARDSADKNSWERTHERLSAQCARRADSNGVLYHRLAMDHVEYVVQQLQAELESGPDACARWLVRFEEATSAPNRLARGETPLALVTRFMRGIGRQDVIRATLTQLTVARWIRSDPLRDPYDELLGTIEDDWRRLGQFFPDCYETFTREADRLRPERINR